MKKFLTVMGLLAAVLATPAFAQSFDPDNGTGNVINVPALEQAGRADANSAFAQAPKGSTHKARVQGSVDSYSPAETGGGSEGYNWMLERDY